MFVEPTRGKSRTIRANALEPISGLDSSQAVSKDVALLAQAGLSEADTNQFQRLQRVRAKRATGFVTRPSTPTNLITSVVFLKPVEHIL